MLSYWAEVKADIDRLVEDFLSGIKEWETLEVSRYILEGGKRFRGTLTVYFTEALGGERKRAYDGALAVEILHSASLALDDIVDYDATRRGKDSAWKVYGNRRVIYVTNFLVPTALEIISTAYGNEAMKVSVNLWKETSIGALLDTFGKPQDYWKTIEYKTGSLFKVSTALASFASDRANLLDAMLEVGKYLGLIYQLVDDYIDVYYYQQGKGRLEGSARQLFELYGDSTREHVMKKFEEYNHAYLETVKKLGVREDFASGVATLPSFLATGLLLEAGIDKL